MHEAFLYGHERPSLLFFFFVLLVLLGALSEPKCLRYTMPQSPTPPADGEGGPRTNLFLARDWRRRLRVRSCGRDACLPLGLDFLGVCFFRSIFSVSFSFSGLFVVLMTPWRSPGRGLAHAFGSVSSWTRRKIVMEWESVDSPLWILRNRAREG